MKIPSRLISSLGAAVAVFCQAAPPAPPQNVRAAWMDGIPATGPLVQWEPESDAVTYNLYRADDTNIAWTVAAVNLATPFYFDPGFEFLPSYYFVTAVNTDGESLASVPTTVIAGEYFGMISFPDIGYYPGTLSATSAVVQWTVSSVAGDEGMLEWGSSIAGETNYAFYSLNTNYLGMQQFVLTNLSPTTVYQLRLTSIGTNRAGLQWVSSFATLDTNHPPVAEDIFFWWPTMTNGMWITLRGYDSNYPPVWSLTFRIVSQPTNGTLSAIQPGWMWNEAYVVYTPNTGARGYDHFQYVVNNGTWDSAPALVTLTNWVNTPPLTTNGYISTAEDTPVTISLPVFDAEGDPITFEIDPWSAWNGTVSGQAPDLVFTPSTNFNGIAYFFYHVTDGFIETYGNFQIEVTPVNDKPTIRTDFMPSVSTWEDQPRSLWLPISDVEGSPSYELLQIVPPAHGILSGDVWSLVYTPETNFFGTDSFTIAVREPDGTTSDPVTLPVEVQPADDPPVAFDQNVTGIEDTPLVIVPSAFDLEADPLTFQVVDYPGHGWVEQTGTNFIYHPLTNFIGEDAFSFRAYDSMFLSSQTAWIYINIADANDAPIAFDTHHNLHSDVIVPRPFNVIDLEGDTLVCEVTQPPLEGTVSVNGTNFTYTPEPGLYDYEASFKYRVSDGQSYGNEAWVTLWIGGTNFTPVAQDQSLTMRGNETLSFSLSIQDNDALDVVIGMLEIAPSNGVVQLTNYGVAYYTPAPGFYGTDSFTYRPYDGFVTGNVATVTITVTPPNRAPVANGSSVSVNEDSTVTVTLSASDPDGDSLTYELITTPTNGILFGAGASRSYTPVANLSGADSFSFRVFDGQLYSAVATVTITIIPVNDPPVATNATVTAYEDNPLTILLGGSDIDNSITSCTFSIITPPAHGTLSSGNRVRIYTPASNYNGPDSFAFQISDGSALSAVATVSINVLPLNDAPVAQWQVITNYEDTSFPITLTGTDVDGDALNFGLLTQPNFGVLSGTPPNLTYRPNTNFNSGSPVSVVDSFVFWVSDGITTRSNVITIVLLPVNDAPIANARSITIPEDTSTNIVLTGSDVDSSSLSFAIVSGPTHGALNGTAPNIVYTPNANFNGTDAVVFSVSDGSLSSTNVVNLTITSVNDAPTLLGYSTAIAEDTPITFTLTASDADNDPLTYIIVSNPSHGTLTGTGPTFTYTPDVNYTGTDMMIVRASDNTATSGNAYVNFTIYNVNDAPTADAQTVSVNEDTPVTISLSGSDIDGNSLMYTLRSLPAHGSISGAALNISSTNANLTYTPVANYNGPDSFTFNVFDGSVHSAVATVVINVAAINDVPTATNRTFSVAEDNSLTISLGGNDVDGDVLTPRIIAMPTNGTLAGSGPAFVYTPNTNFNGVDHFTYTVNDGTSDGNVGTITINVNAVDDLPVAIPQTVTTDEDTPVEFVLQGFDVDDAEYFVVQTLPANGGLNGVPPALRYTPNANFNGTDSFIFGVDDNRGHRITNLITLIVRPVNDAPVTSNKSATTAEDTAVTINVSGTDADNDTLSYNIISEPTNGTASVNGANVTYTPNGNYNGTDTFTYRANDGTTNGNISIVTITITPVNDAPTASSQSVATDEDTAVGIALQSADPENNLIFYSIVTPPAHGTLTGAGSARTYTPAPNYNGPDSFTFVSFDQWATGNVATVTIMVRAVNDVPIANAQSVTTDEDTALPIALGASDADGDALSYTIVSVPVNGTLSGNGASRTYTPNANFNGADSFTFRVNDGQVDGNTATVSITVRSVNDAPVADAQSVTVVYNTARAVTLTGSDLEGSAITYAIVDGPTNGTLSGTGPNITYTPNIGSAGADFFTFRVNDGSSNSDPATVSVTTLIPTGVPAAPSALTVTVPTTKNTLILNWSCTATNEDGFKIERSLNSSSGWSQVATTGINVLSFTNLGLTSNTRYYYRVRSYNRLGDSAYSNTANGKPR